MVCHIRIIKNTAPAGYAKVHLLLLKADLLQCKCAGLPAAHRIRLLGRWLAFLAMRANIDNKPC
jgi:hypothetical protein